MKKIILICTLFALTANAIFAQHDPEGTITIALRNSVNHPDNTFTVAGTDIPLQMTNGNNLQAKDGNKWEFVSVGRRDGISGIQKIPSEGWTSKVRLEPNQAIVARFESKQFSNYKPVYLFVAIYVDRWLTGTKENDGIIGAIIRYKAPFEPTVQAAKRLFFDTYIVNNESLAKWYLKYADSDNDGAISPSEANATTILGSTQDAIATLGPENIESFENLTCFNNLREIHIHNFPEKKLYGWEVQNAIIKHPTLEKIVFDDVEVPVMDLRNCPRLHEIDMSFCKIKKILLPPSIERVDLRNGTLASIDVTKCPKLTYLQVGGNQLTSLNLSGNPKLETLSVGDNQLTSLDVAQLKNLKKLYCANNRFPTLDLSQNPSIEVLSVADSKGSLKRVIIPQGKSKRDYKTESGTLASFSGIEVVTAGQKTNNEAQTANSTPSQTGIYHIGDAIKLGSKTGIVFSVTDGGRHGKAVSLSNKVSHWHKDYQIGSGSVGYNNAPTEMLNMFQTGATSMSDGKTNTDKIVRAARAIEAKTGEKLGKHEMLYDLINNGLYEEGWYIPAIDELQDIYNAVAQDNLNEALKKNGGNRIWKNGYISSTEYYSSKYDHSFMECYVMWMPNGQQLVYHKNDDLSFLVIYIHAF